MSKNVFDISQELMSNAYPGRGIILGRTPDNKKNVIAYFIMGRSENSRNRVFTETEDGIRTEAFDPSKMVDPSLIIYHPVRLYNGTLVVTNGDQTDTIVDYLKQGKSYFEALRTREFEQMELEFFCKPGTDLEWFKYWKDYCHNFLLSLGMKDENLRLRDHDPEELSHYSNATTDIEFMFPFGWGELWGIADRTNFDLTQHQNTSGVSMEYFDQEANEKYIPYVIEPSLGADRVALAFLCDAYDEEVVGQDKNGKDDVRTVLRLHPALAPFKAAVLPLSKKLTDKAMPIWQELAKQFSVDFDDAGSIGKRYRREDEIGTPYCVTVDFETEQDGCVTVRDRDTMEQERIKIEEVAAYIAKKIEF